jgi:pimeloyl-ACP methyl ester carboxylesterase
MGRGARIGLGLLVMAALAGCGGGDEHAQAPRPTTTTAPDTLPSAIDGCDGTGSGWRRFDVRAPEGRLDGAVLGTGATGVVLANESGNIACGWMPLATELAKSSRVVVFDYFDKNKAATEVLAEARALRSAGAKRVAIVGASIGGRAVVQAAARGHGTVDAAVSLSAERTVGTLPELLPDARQVRVPSLYVSSRDDGFTNFGRDTRQLYRATPAKTDKLLIVPGGDHGTDLLPSAQLRHAIDAFVHAHAG